jgi:DNA-binding LacI/PurR family transcriptional regulator
MSVAKSDRGSGGGFAYRHIASDLRARFERGELLPGEELPSLRALAARHSASIFTVRSALQVLHREGLIRMRPHRRAIVREAVNVPGRVGGTVAMVTTTGFRAQGHTRYSQQLMNGIAGALDETSASLLHLAHVHFKTHVPEEILSLPLKGVLLLGGFTPATLRDYDRVELPVVLVDQPAAGGRKHSAAVDNAGMGRLIAERLLALGHERVLYVRYLHLLTGQPDPDDQERETALRRAMRSAGLPRTALRVFNCYTSGSETSVELSGVLESEGPYSAVVVATRERAQSILEIGASLGLNVPDDLSVVCIGDASAGADHFSGPRIDFVELGLRGVRLLDEPKTPPIQHRVPVTWNSGQTLGVARHRDAPARRPGWSGPSGRPSARGPSRA